MECILKLSSFYYNVESTTLPFPAISYFPLFAGMKKLSPFLPTNSLLVSLSVTSPSTTNTWWNDSSVALSATVPFTAIDLTVKYPHVTSVASSPPSIGANSYFVSASPALLSFVTSIAFAT